VQFKGCSDDGEELSDHFEDRIIDQNVVAGNPHGDLGIGSEIKQWIDPQVRSGIVKASENQPIGGIDWGLIRRSSGTTDMIGIE
jgi:hypothetical protein